MTQSPGGASRVDIRFLQKTLSAIGADSPGWLDEALRISLGRKAAGLEVFEQEIDEAIKVLEEKAAHIASRRSDIRWLELLRILASQSPQFEWWQPARVSAEYFTSLYGERYGRTQSSPDDPYLLARLIRLTVAHARLVHARLQLKMGATLICDARGWPEGKFDEATASASTLFLDRLAARTDDELGVAGYKASSTLFDTDDMGNIFMVTRETAAPTLNVFLEAVSKHKLGPSHFVSFPRALTSFFQHLRTVSALLTADERNVIAISVLLLQRYTANAASNPGPWLTQPAALGYSTTTTKVLQEIFAEFSSTEWLSDIGIDERPEISLESFMYLNEITTRSLPHVHGDMIRVGENDSVVDYVAISAKMAHIMRVARLGGGALGKARGDNFESQVRDVINASRWKPPPEFQGMTGKKHRFPSGFEMELDAIGVDGNKILLVEAKSYIRTAEYDLGIGFEISGRAGNLDEDARKQVRRVGEAVKGEKTTAGLQIPEGFDVIGLVCVPDALFANPGVATEFVGLNLRRVCTLAELDEALR